MRNEEEKDDMATLSTSLKRKMDEVKRRAEMRKQDPNLRHHLTDEENKIYTQNCKDFEAEQFRSMDKR